MAAQCVMNVPAIELGMALNPPASFPRELHISLIEDFLQAAHNVFELTVLTHDLRSSSGTWLLINMPVISVVVTEPLLAPGAFPMVG